MARGLGLLVLACWAAATGHAFLMLPASRPTSTATSRLLAATDGASGSSNKAASQPRATTLLNDLKPGMKLHGGVVGVTDFAAFLDVHVVRKGPGGRLVRCNAVLHPNDVPKGYKLLRDGQPLPLEHDPHVIRRGEHLVCYVKDVLVNNGRFSVSLEKLDKSKVVKARMQKRAQGKKRNKIEPIKDVQVGDEMQGAVVKVLRRGLLLDVGLPVPVFLAHSAVPDEDTLQKACRKGRRMTVRVSEKTEKQIKTELLQLLD